VVQCGPVCCHVLQRTTIVDEVAVSGMSCTDPCQQKKKCVLQCVALCSVLQCDAAVRCSVLPAKDDASRRSCSIEQVMNWPIRKKKKKKCVFQCIAACCMPRTTIVDEAAVSGKSFASPRQRKLKGACCSVLQ